MTPFAHGPEVLAALAEPDAPHSRKAAAAAERHDLTLMQPLFSEPAFLLSTPCLLQCWTFIVKRMYFLSCAHLDFSAFRLLILSKDYAMQSLMMLIFS